ISGTSRGFPSAVTVTATNPAANWTAVSNDPWITITSGAQQTGTGVVTYRVDQNTGPRRTGTMTIAGLTFVVIQGPAACYFTLNQNIVPALAAGDNIRVTVTASSPGCPWVADANSNFITVTSGSSGTGDGVVNLSIAPNPSVQSHF